MIRRFRNAAIVLAAGFAGIMGAHALDYLIVYREGAARHRALVETGHGASLHTIPQWVAAATVSAIIAAVVAGFRARRSSGDHLTRFGPVCGTLAALQTGGFVALELLERAAAHQSPTHALEPTLWLGIALQVAVAAVATVVLLLLHRAGAAIARMLGSRTRAPERPSSTPRPRVRILAGRALDASPSRGPPARARC